MLNFRLDNFSHPKCKWKGHFPLLSCSNHLKEGRERGKNFPGMKEISAFFLPKKVFCPLSNFSTFWHFHIESLVHVLNMDRCVMAVAFTFRSVWKWPSIEWLFHCQTITQSLVSWGEVGAVMGEGGNKVFSEGWVRGRKCFPRDQKAIHHIHMHAPCKFKKWFWYEESFSYRSYDAAKIVYSTFTAKILQKKHLLSVH